MIPDESTQAVAPASGGTAGDAAVAGLSEEALKKQREEAAKAEIVKDAIQRMMQTQEAFLEQKRANKMSVALLDNRELNIPDRSVLPNQKGLNQTIGGT